MNYRQNELNEQSTVTQDPIILSRFGIKSSVPKIQLLILVCKNKYSDLKSTTNRLENVQRERSGCWRLCVATPNQYGEFLRELESAALC